MKQALAVALIFGEKHARPITSVQDVPHYLPYLTHGCGRDEQRKQDVPTSS